MVVVWIGLLIVSALVAPAPRAAAPTNSTFVGTTFTNEHFIMNIAATGATMVRVQDGYPLVGNLYWDIERLANGTWSALPWTSGPTLSQENAGDLNEWHRVAVRGAMDERLDVNIYFDGKAVDVPSAGPKISVDIQAINGTGTYRMAWQFRNIVANYFQFELRVGEQRTLIAGPYSAGTVLTHYPGGDNSLVALDESRQIVYFGANWDSTLPAYQEADLLSVSGQPGLRFQFGEFTLNQGEQYSLDPMVDGGGGGGGGGYPRVTISNVVVDSNSLSGTTATITWATNPANACDRFDWGTSTNYGNTIFLVCGTHTVTLNNLARHRTYFFKITSSKSGYYDGVYANSFYPTDASLSKAYQSYQMTSGWNNCGAVVNYHFLAETPGDISYNASKTQNPNNYEVFDIHLYYEGTGHAGCWPWTIGTKRTRWDVYVTDSDSVMNWIAAKDYVIYSGYSGGSGTVSWGINVGADLKGAQFGASATYTPASGPSFSRSVQNADGGWYKYFGYFQVEWPQQAYVSLDAMWPIFVFDQNAQYRIFDKVTFIFEMTTWIDTFNGAWWYGNCGGPGCPESTWFTLGDGDWNGNNILDQFTNVQSGYMTAPEG